MLAQSAYIHADPKNQIGPKIGTGQTEIAGRGLDHDGIDVHA